MDINLEPTFVQANQAKIVAGTNSDHNEQIKTPYFLMQVPLGNGEEGQVSYMLPLEFKQFSEIAQDDFNEYANSKIEFISKVISSEIKVTLDHLKLINTFMKMHSYSVEGVKINKVYTKGYEDVYDDVTYKFIKEHISVLDEEMVVEFMKSCEYLKVNLLKKALCTYIASIYHKGFDEKKMRQQMTKLNATINWEMEEFIKKQYSQYFCQLGKDIFEQVRVKEHQKSIEFAKINKIPSPIN